jgi:F-type H+-transporting ATPase subunit b
LPQLDTSTFASQVFWVLVGFSLTYLFVSSFFAPRVEKILSNRDLHVDCILREARSFKSEAEKIKRDSDDALENAKAASIAADSELASAFKEQSLREKKELGDLFLAQSQRESDLLAKSSEKAFSYALERMDEMVDAATRVVVGKKA